MTDRAMALRAEGRDIISLSVGEPDFATPAHVVQAARTRSTPATRNTPPSPDRPGCARRRRSISSAISASSFRRRR
jgi:aspartate/methionine/tyrosine aminotransferase